MFKFCVHTAVFTVFIASLPAACLATEIKGCVKVKDSLDRVPEFRVLFRGKETMSNSEGFYSIPLDNDRLDNFYLLICEQVRQHFDKKTNTLKDIVLGNNKSFKCFNFSHFGSTWMRREVAKVPSTVDLQERTMIVLMDPKHLEGIEPWEVDFPNSIIKLPKLVLKKGLTTQKLAQASASSLLSSLDETSFHEPVKEVVQKVQNNQKVRVTLAR